MSKIDVSVVICAYNAEKRILPTLRHLHLLQCNFSWDVIIVDNNSTDNSFELISDWIEEKGVTNFKVIREFRQGKTYAWETALTHSEARYLMICDDDNWLPPDFINKALSFLELHTQYAVMGVRADGVFENTPPIWFEKFRKSFAVGSQYETSREVTFENNKVWGAGTIIRRSAIDYLYNNEFLHFFKGIKSQGMGEDHELFFALRLAGYRIYYNDEISLQHFMPKERLTWSYAANIYKQAAISSYLFDPYEKACQPVNAGIQGLLKRTAFYQIYVSLIILLKLKPSLTDLITGILPDSPEKKITVFYHKNRIKGLLKNAFQYPSFLNRVKNAKWRKKDLVKCYCPEL